MTNPPEQEGLYNNIIDSLCQIKNNNIRDMNELNMRIQSLEAKNTMLAGHFEKIIDILRRG